MMHSTSTPSCTIFYRLSTIHTLIIVSLVMLPTRAWLSPASTRTAYMIPVLSLTDMGKIQDADCNKATPAAVRAARADIVRTHLAGTAYEDAKINFVDNVPGKVAAIVTHGEVAKLAAHKEASRALNAAAELAALKADLEAELKVELKVYDAKFQDVNETMELLARGWISPSTILPFEIAAIIVQAACDWFPRLSDGKGGALQAKLPALRCVIQCMISDLEAGNRLRYTPMPDKQVAFGKLDTRFSSRPTLLRVLKRLLPRLSDEQIEARHDSVPNLLDVAIAEAFLRPSYDEGATETIGVVFEAATALPSPPDLTVQERAFKKLRTKLRKSSADGKEVEKPADATRGRSLQDAEENKS